MEENLEVKKNNGSSKLLLIAMFGFGIIFLVLGIYMNMNAEEEEEEYTAPTVTVGISNTMKDFMNHVSEDGSDVISSARNRKLLINMELESDRSETTDEGMQPMGYVDYSVYKERYEKIFGELYSLSYDLEQETAGGPDIKSCNNYPSVADQNKVCWSINLGQVANTINVTISNQTQKDNILVVEGRYSKTFPDDSSTKGTFKMIYKIVDGEAYLKELSLTKI